MDEKDLRLAAVEAVARIDARITEKLRKRARKHGLTDREADALAEAWKQAAKKTDHWRLPLRAQAPPNSGNSVEL